MSIFDWKKFKKVANHLLNYSNEEEYHRSSIGRFYYSSFGPLKEYYEKTFKRILPSKNSHQILINELENSPFIEEQELGKDLRKLRKLRNYADYNPKKIHENVVFDSKEDAEKIFKNLEYLKNNPLRKS